MGRGGDLDSDRPREDVTPDERTIWRDRLMTWSAFHVARHPAAKITVMCELVQMAAG
jgi:hypothetical protein